MPEKSENTAAGQPYKPLKLFDHYKIIDGENDVCRLNDGTVVSFMALQVAGLRNVLQVAIDTSNGCVYRVLDGRIGSIVPGNIVNRALRLPTLTEKREAEVRADREAARKRMETDAIKAHIRDMMARSSGNRVKFVALVERELGLEFTLKMTGERIEHDGEDE